MGAGNLDGVSTKTPEPAMVAGAATSSDRTALEAPVNGASLSTTTLDPTRQVATPEQAATEVDVGANRPAFEDAPMVADEEVVRMESEPELSVYRSVVSLPGVSVRGRNQRRDSRRARRRARKSDKLREPAESPADAQPSKSKPIEGLAAPKATASAMSVVIPSAGQRVRYQRVLLERDAHFTIQIDAREPLLGRFRR